MDLIDWLDERLENCRRLAKAKHGDERQGWIEDLSYFARAKEAVRLLIEASGDNHANSPLRTYIALRVMRAWNSGTQGYDALVVMTINDWIDSGCNGPIPWPDSPFFTQWAERVGFSKVGHYIGFKFDAELVGRER